jgi:hypothetical protein
MEQKISVHHWRFEDGWHLVPAILLRPGEPENEYRMEVVGWHCWVYCNNHHEFLNWMKEHCPEADCTPRFNSGDPMITVHITNKDEAAYFMLNFDV